MANSAAANSSPRTPTFRAEVSNIAAHYSLENGDATLHDFRATLLGGEVNGPGHDEERRRRFAFEVQRHIARHLTCKSAKRMVGSAASTGPVAIAGTLDATASATWGKTFRRPHCPCRRDDPRRRRQRPTHDIRGAQLLRRPPVQVLLRTTSVPVEGDLHATYTCKTQELAVEHSYFRTPQTNLNLNGTISKSSSLAVQLQANDLREVETIADLFRTPAPGQPLQPLGLAGTASFNGVVRGSTSAPHLTGQLIAQNLQFQGSSWKLVRTNVDASPSSVSLQHAELDPATQGHLTLNASAQLRNWSFSKSSPVQLQLNASQLDISELAKLAGQSNPRYWYARRRHQHAR